MTHAHGTSAALALLVLSLAAPGGGVRPQDPTPADDSGGGWICPPCDNPCDARPVPAAGACAGCGMRLVPVDGILDVAVLLPADVDALSVLLPIAIFEASGHARVFTVSDTTDPVDCGALELVAKHTFEDAPLPDVLILPAMGPDAAGDALVVEWVARAAAEARAIAAAHGGVLLLARAGALAGEAAAPPWVPRFAGEDEADVRFRSDVALARAGKVATARDPGGLLALSFALVAELSGEEAARAAVRDTGLPWGGEGAR